MVKAGEGKERNEEQGKLVFFKKSFGGAKGRHQKLKRDIYGQADPTGEESRKEKLLNGNVIGFSKQGGERPCV